LEGVPNRVAPPETIANLRPLIDARRVAGERWQRAMSVLDRKLTMVGSSEHAKREGEPMEPVWIVMTAVLSLAAGIAVGLLLLRQGRAAAALEAQHAAAQEIATLRQEVKNWESRARDLGTLVAQQEEGAAKDRDLLVALSSDLARARAVAEQVPALTASLDARSRQLDDARAEVQAAKVALAQAQKELERIPELERALVERRDEMAAVQAVRDEERRRTGALAEQLAKAEADLAASSRRLEEDAGEIARLRARADALQTDVTTLVEEKTRLATDLDAQRKAVVERAAEAERTKEQVRAEIEVLAGRLLDEKGKAMLNQSREGLEVLLKPVADKLREFEAKVEKTYDQENRDRASLLTSLQRLQETQAKLHEDAESLARALTGESKAQGDWGELVLERVLETAGLTEGREYDLQVSHVDEEGGRKRPDALVYLPGNRVVVVDAKCSLTAFVEAMRGESAALKDAALDAHVASVRAHVRELAAKSYQDVVKGRSVDIVLLFVPNEAAFHAAISREAGLYEEAFRQRVVICSPTTLLAALQLISHVWRSEKQNANAQRIAVEAGKLLEKLSAFVEDLNEVGSRLDQARTSFDTARNKLATGKGNVLKKASDLMKLGARVRPDKVDALLLEAAAGEDPLELLALGDGKVSERSTETDRAPAV
jgi:DNA recombination protein RmuC